MKIMAVDYGDARTGLAVCDRTEFLASPVGTIEEKSFAKVAEKIVYAILPIPVELWDERQTTIAAANILSENGTYGKKRKKVLDSVAATVILESYLAFRKNSGKHD